jgi:hypothetical protein
VAALRKRRALEHLLNAAGGQVRPRSGVGRVHRALASVPAPDPPGRRRLSGVFHSSLSLAPTTCRQRGHSPGNPRATHVRSCSPSLVAFGRGAGTGDELELRGCRPGNRGQWLRLPRGLEQAVVLAPQQHAEMWELARPIAQRSDGALCRPQVRAPDGGRVSGA